MLNTAVRNTRKLIRQKSEEEKIRIGNRFTKKETASCMASLLSVRGEVLHILDPGAGTGILTAACVEALVQGGGVSEIYATLYETDPFYIPTLITNMKKIRRKCHHDHAVKFRFEIREADFLAAYGGETPAEKQRFDIVLLSGEDVLAEKDEPALLRESAYFRVPVSRSYLFLLAALRALKPEGECAAVVPTAFATAPSLLKCRTALFSHYALTRVHLFAVQAKRRETTGERNDVLRKNMLLCWRKTVPSDSVLISASYDEGASIRMMPEQKFSFLVRGEEKTMLLFQSEEELALVSLMESLPETPDSLSLQMKTGLVLPSRYPDLFSDTEKPGYVPLFSPAGIQGGRLVFPLPEKNQYILPRIPSLKQKNRNMLLLKRVPSKKDGRHLTAAVYLASQFPWQGFVATHNKLMYMDSKNGEELDAPFLYGLYTLFNSTLYERYFSILSMSRQVTTGDYRHIPLPTGEVIRKLGRTVMTTRQYTARACDILVKNALLPKEA